MTANYELQELRREVSELKELVLAQAKATEGLVDAWKTAQGMVRLVKAVGYIAAAAAAVWSLFRMGKN